VIFVVSIIPVVQLIMQSREPSWLPWVPVAGQYSLLSHAVRGEAISITTLAQSYALPLALTALALAALARLLSRESLLAGR
ncbi:MAG TPA: ABC transporter permease, partial [Casimicrobiaceae bacterium]|nr:ABC transporter permease [Casimicrobiaceae bacterium]